MYKSAVQHGRAARMPTQQQAQHDAQHGGMHPARSAMPCGTAAGHLWGVVDDDGVREVAAQHRQVLQVVALHEHAAVPEHAVPDHAPAGSPCAATCQRRAARAGMSCPGRPWSSLEHSAAGASLMRHAALAAQAARWLRGRSAAQLQPAWRPFGGCVQPDRRAAPHLSGSEVRVCAAPERVVRGGAPRRVQDVE